jgi:hypothetical protein
VPDEAIGCGFHEGGAGVLSHHLCDRDGKIANYHPYPPTPWNAKPARHRTAPPGPYEDAFKNTPIFEENGPDKFKGIDIYAHVRSFDPCLPCGVSHVRRRSGASRDAAFADLWRWRTACGLNVARARRTHRIEQLISNLDALDEPRARTSRRARSSRRCSSFIGTACAASSRSLRERADGSRVLEALARDDAVAQPVALHDLHSARRVRFVSDARSTTCARGSAREPLPSRS